MDWIIANWKDICLIITAISTIASVIVKLTPTVSDDNIILPVIKFIAKYIALNTNSPDERPK